MDAENILPRAMPDAVPPRRDPRALDRVLDRFARADTAPWLHQEVARRMAQRLVAIRQPAQRWLDWWGHAGGSAAAVTSVWPQAERSVVEPTSALAERSRASLRTPWWSPWRRGDQRRRLLIVDDVPAGGTQMVWANMMLHWVADEQATLARWQRALVPEGWLMFSTFGPQTLRALREIYADAGWRAPHAPFTDMHDLGDQLVHAGFADPVMDQEMLTLTWTSPQAALAELRVLGGNSAPGRDTGLRTPRWRERLGAALAARAGADGRVALQFEIVYGHAVKGQPRAGRDGETTIGVDALRQSLRARRGRGRGF